MNYLGHEIVHEGNEFDNNDIINYDINKINLPGMADLLRLILFYRI